MPTPFLVGHIDTGICAEHPLLHGKVAHFTAIDSYGKLIDGVEAYDPDGHGSHTAGIICREAPQARLHSVAISSRGKVLLSLLAAMDVLLASPVRLLCMALGFCKYSPLFLPVVNAFREKGVLIVAAIGNKGAGKAHAPASYPGVLSLGAADETGHAAFFSGSCKDPEGLYMKPDLLAPGCNIPSAVPEHGTGKKSGTSMAAAHLTGVAARLWQQCPDARAVDIRQALLATADPLSSSRYRHQGRGVVQADQALSYLTSMKYETAETEPVPLPAFLRDQYVDPRFYDAYEWAHPDALLEAIIVPFAYKQVASGGSHQLIEEVAQDSRIMPEQVRFFKHVDMVYIQALRSFYDVLLKHPGLFVCHAVDVSIFDL